MSTPKTSLLRMIRSAEISGPGARDFRNYRREIQAQTESLAMETYACLQASQGPSQEVLFKRHEQKRFENRKAAREEYQMKLEAEKAENPTPRVRKTLMFD